MSLKIKIYNSTSEEVGELDLAKNLFAVPVNTELLHQAVVTQRNNARQTLAHTKTRSEVAGGGRKPWQQKGTGRARAGSSRSPIWTGGGVTFGPRKERNFKQKINQKMRQKAIFMALSDRVANNTMAVVDKIDLKEYKTKALETILNDFDKKVFKTDRRSTLIISSVKDDKLKYSLRNLQNTKLINLDNINVVDILAHRNLLLTENAVTTFTKRYNK